MTVDGEPTLACTWRRERPRCIGCTAGALGSRRKPGGGQWFAGRKRVGTTPSHILRTVKGAIRPLGGQTVPGPA